MKKRILAALLALVMLFGALPMSVFAEDLETVEEPSGTFEPEQPQPDITDPTEFIGIKTVPVQCDNKAGHYMEYAIDGLIEKKCAELVWSTGSKEATLKLYPEKIAKRFSALKGTHTAVSTSVVTVTLAYNGGWKIDGAIPVIYVTCAAPEIPDPTEFIGIKTVPVQCNNKADHYMQYAIDGLIEKKCAELVWSTGSKEATLKLYPEKIANRFSALKGTHTAVSTSVVTVTLTYNGSWKIDGAIPVIYVTCAAPVIPNPTDYVKEQYVTVVCDDQTAHPNIQYLLENLPAGSMEVQWDGTAKTAKLVLKPEKIAEHYGKSYGAHTAVNPADVKVSLTYANDAWSLSAAIPDVHVTCKPAQEIPSPKNSFDKLFVKVACNTENSGHDPLEVPLSEVSSSVEVQWKPDTATAYIKLTPSIFATYYSQHNNGAHGAHDPVAPAAVMVEAHYDNEKGWSWTKPTINVKCKTKTIKLIYDANAGTDKSVANMPDGESVTIGADVPHHSFTVNNKKFPTRSGYKFLGWNTSADATTAHYKVEDLKASKELKITTGAPSVTLYAIWEKNPFTVNYHLKDENGKWQIEHTEKVNVADCDTHPLWTPTEKKGYTFTGWYEKAKDIGVKGKVTKLFDKKWELYGDFTPVEYKIEYDYRDNDIKTKGLYPKDNAATYTIENEVVLKPITAKGMFGKTFMEWRCDLDGDGKLETLEKREDGTSIIPAGTTGDLTVKAYWNYPVNYTVYDEAGAKVADLCKTDTISEDELEAGYELTVPARDGYAFDGWYQSEKDLKEGGKTISKLTGKAKKWELYGVLKYVEKPVYVYVQPTYKGAPLTKNDAKAVAALERLGFENGGFNKGGSYATLGKLMTAKTDVAGMADEIDNGKLELYSAINTAKFNEHVLRSIGWYGENALTLVTNTPHKGYEDDGKIEAYHLNGTMSFQSVTFDTEAENEVENMPEDGYYLVNDHITLGEPTREGYTFLGWSAAQDTPVITANPETDGETLYPADHEWNVIGDVIFTARWKLITTPVYAYFETVDADGKALDIGDDLRKTLGLELNKNGNYWYSLGILETATALDPIPAFDSSDVVKYAKDSTQYTTVAGELAAALADSTSTNFARHGENEAFAYAANIEWTGEFKTAKAADHFMDGSEKNCHAYHFDGKLPFYTVTYNAGEGVEGVEVPTDGGLYLEGQKAHVSTDTPTRTGYNFKGWLYEGELVMTDTIEIKDKNAVLTADWEKKDYTIAATLYLNGADAKNSYHEPNVGYAWSHRYGGKFEEPIDYAPMIKAVKEKAEEAVGGDPEKEWTEVQLCYPNQTKLFNEKVLTYGQNTANWQVIEWRGKVNNIAYIWARVNTYYRVKFDANGGSDVSDKKVQTGSSLAATYPNSDDLNTMKPGYTFLGWYTAAEGGDKVELTAPVTKSMTLYAHWKAAAPVYTEATLFVECRVKGSEKLLKTVKYTTDEDGSRLMAPGTYTIKTPKISGYTAVKKTVEVTLGSAESTITVYYKRNSGGSGTYDSPNKPTKKAPALTLNTDDHFAFINGYPNGTVQPEGNVTRAETAAILYRIMGDECQSYYKTTSSTYSDVARGDWYNTYVATLENAGVIVDTRTNGKFRPNDAITRAELASMIAQFAGLESASAAKFNDVGSRYWAAAEIAIAAKMGWINGYPDGSFRPDRNVTRAELMAMVNRALGRTPKSEDDLLSGMKTWRDNANVNAWYYLDVQEATNDHTYTKYGTHETWKKLL